MFCVLGDGGDARVVLFKSLSRVCPSSFPCSSTASWHACMCGGGGRKGGARKAGVQAWRLPKKKKALPQFAACCAGFCFWGGCSMGCGRRGGGFLMMMTRAFCPALPLPLRLSLSCSCQRVTVHDNSTCTRLREGERGWGSQA